jgi:hypothetical protein
VTCPRRRTVAAPEFPRDVPSLVESLHAYLNAGGDPVALAHLLSEAYDPNSREVLDSEVLLTDLSGDYIDEIVIAVSLDLLREDGWHSSSSGLVLFSCGDADYDVFFRDASPGMPAYYVHGYTLFPVRGATATNSSDLLFFEDIGGNFCERQIALLSRIEGEWGIRWIDLGRCDVEVAVADVDIHGPMEVLVLGAEGESFWQSYRHVLRMYRFNAAYDEFFLLSTEAFPPIFRIEVLEDARSATESGRYMEAWRYYLEVATSDSLAEFPSWFEDQHGMGDETASSYQRAFARFRIVWLWLRLGFHDRAVDGVDEMGFLFPPSAPGGEFTTLAQSLVRDVTAGTTLGEACSRMTSTMVEEYPDLAGTDGHIGRWSHVHVNPYDPDDICPSR